jgi:DNA-binding MarR family transcriptional regulator
MMARPRVRRDRSSTTEISRSLKRERPDLNSSDYLYLLLVQRLGRVLDTFDEKHCRRDFGISGADMRILYALRRAGPPYALRPTELFYSLLVSSGAVTKQVDRLQRAGFVKRSAGPANSGGSLIVLTPRGFDIVDRGLSTLVDWSRQIVTSLNRKERQLLCDLCDKMIADFERHLDSDNGPSTA